jgi:hypothetical protein
MSAAKSGLSLTKSQSELLAYLFDSRHSLLSRQMTDWIKSSPRYTKFIATFKSKIRKKIRVSESVSAQADLLQELHIPLWLLQDDRFEVHYEPAASGKIRGPDYSVRFRGNFTFNIEATHLRRLTATQVGGVLIDFRVADTICSKLSQMLPNMANLLFIASSHAVLEALDLPTHLTWIKSKAERRDREFYARHKFSNTSDFFKHYERLSGVILFGSSKLAVNSLWLNPQARVKLPAQLLTVLRSLG